MNTTVKYILIFFLTMVSSLSVFAQKVYTVEEVPNVHLQDRNAYVSDPEQKLTSEHRKLLNEKLRFFEDSLAIQCATIVIPAIDEEPSTFAHNLFNKWGVGDRATDRGLVVLLVYGSGKGSQRDIYIATGYGMEADLPDGLLKRVQMEKMIPLLEKEKFGEGLLAGLDYIQELLANPELREEINDTGSNSDFNSGDFWFGFGTYLVTGIIFLLVHFISSLREIKKEKDPYLKYIYVSSIKNIHGKSGYYIGCFAIFLFWIFFFPLIIPYYLFVNFFKRNKRKRLVCPHCHIAGKMKKSGGVTILKKAVKMEKGLKQYKFVCSNCWQEHSVELEYKSSYAITSEYSSSSGGGGGGSWGGGSSGGGGSGSSF